MHSSRRFAAASRLALILHACLAAFACALVPVARAQLTPFYFDSNGTVAGLGAASSATWTPSASLWATVSTGTAAVSSWPNSSTSLAVFSGTGNTVTIGSPVTAGGLDFRSNNYTLAGSSSPLTLAGSAPSISIFSGVSTTISARLAGSAGFEKLGFGTLTLSGTSTSLAGTLRLSAGTLNLGNTSVLGTTTLSLNGGTLAATGAARTVVNNVLVDSNSVIGGSLALLFNTGTFRLTGGRTLTVNNTALTTLANGLGETTAASAFTKAGNGTLLVNGALSYTGATTIAGGTFALGTGVSLPATSLTLSGGGTLAAQGTFTRPLGTGTGQFQFGSGGGGFSAYGGDLTVTLSGAEAWAGAFFVPDNSPLVLNSAAANATLHWTSDLSLGNAARTITVAASTARITGSLLATGPNAGVTKTGAGTLVLANDDNSYPGPTVVQAGTLSFSSIGSVGGAASALGTPADTTAGTLKLGSGTSAVALAYTGTGHTTDRALELTGTTGAVTLDAGPAGGLVFTNGIYTTGLGAKTLTLTGAGLTVSEIRGAITDLSNATVGLTKSGAGTWLLTGDNTYTGATTVLAGTLAFDSIANVNAAPSALGNPANSTTGRIDLGNGTATTATLRYTGAGHTTDRTLRLDGHAAVDSSGAGALALASATATGAYTLTLTGDNPADNTLASVGGSGALEKTGAGHWIVSGARTHAGATTVSAGTLTLRGAASGTGAINLNAGGTLALENTATLSTGTLTFAGGTLAVARSGLEFMNALSLAASSTVSSTHDLTFHGKLTHTAAADSTLTLSSPGVTTLNNGINLSNTSSNRAVTFDVTNAAGTLRIFGTVANGSTSTLSGLAKSGPGTLILTADSTYGGLTTINDGTFRLEGGFNGTFASSGIALGATAWIDFNRFENVAYAGPISGPGSLRKSGLNTLTLSGPLDYSGTTRIDGGTLLLNSPLPAGSTAFVFTNLAGAAPTLQASTSFALGAQHRITFDTTPTLDLAAGTTLTYAGVIAGPGGFYKYGTGTLDLSQSIENAYHGATILHAGTLVLGADTSLGTAPASATPGHLYFTTGTLRSTADFTLNANRGITLFNSATLHTDAATTLAYGGLISGAGTLTKSGAGTLDLSGSTANTYTGATTLNAGTLALDADHRLGAPATTSVVPFGGVITNRTDRLVFNGGTLRATDSFTLHSDRGLTLNAAGGTLAADAGTTLTSTAQIAGSGALTKSGPGTLVLSSSSNFSGGTTISAGTLRISHPQALGSGAVRVLNDATVFDLAGQSIINPVTAESGGVLRGSGRIGPLTVAPGGVISPGASPGTLNATSAVFGPAGSYHWETNSVTGTPGTHWDLLSVSGALTITATSENPFILSLLSLTPTNAPGDVFNFNSTSNYSFTLATTTEGIFGLTPGSLLVNATGFTNPETGTWSLTLTNNNLDLVLNYTGTSAIPEPSTYTALAGLTCLVFVLLRQRRRSA